MSSKSSADNGYIRGMSLPQKIIGSLFLAGFAISSAFKHHWWEMFAWIVALGSWYMAGLQESRIRDAHAEIASLKKQIEDRP